MSSDSLHPILIDAKREYQVRLTDLMTPFLMYYVNDTYACAKEDVGNRNALIEFQRLLHAVPQWNSGIIRERTEAIEKKFSFFSNLVAAVFVATIKVLSSIRITSQRPNIKLKLPSNDAFVHKVYVCVARNFYENVTVMRDGDLATKKRMICNGIETAVRDMLPLGEVLTAYLSTAVDDANQVNPVLSPVQSDDEDAVSSIDSSSSDEEDTQSKIVPLDSNDDFPTPMPSAMPNAMPEMAETQQHAFTPPQQVPFPQQPPFQPEMPQSQSQPQFQPQSQPEMPQPYPQHQNTPQTPHQFDQTRPKPPLFPDADDDDRHFR